MSSATSTLANHQPSDREDVDDAKNEYGPSNPDFDERGRGPSQILAPVPSTTPVDGDWVSGFKLFNIITALALVCLLVMLDISIIVTAIPHITSQFHSLQDVGWYGGAYQLASAALVPLTGKMFMSFDSKWTFMIFFAVFELGSLVCGLATSSKMLIIGRAVAGLGSAGLLTGALTIISACVPMAKRPTLIGLVIGVSNIGLVLGPLVGGALTQYSTWRWCFYLNLPFGGLIAAMLAFTHVPNQIAKPKPLAVLRSLPSHFDLIGFALFAPAAIQLLLALQYGGVKFPWDSSQVIGLFCGSAGTFLVFLAWEYHKGDAAMIPLSVIQNKVIWSSNLAYGFLMAQLVCGSYYLPIYFQGVKGVSPTLSGVYLLPAILGQLFTSIAVGILIGRVGYYLPFGLLGGIFIALGNGLLSTLSPGTSIGKWIGFQILLGFGRGLGLQVPLIAVQSSLPPRQIPIVMALLMFSQSLFSALFLTFASTIFTNSLTTLIPQYAPSVDPKAVITAGATGFRTIINGEDLAEVLVAYAKSIDRVFYLAAAGGVCCFVFAWGMGWRDVRKRKEVGKV